MSVQKTQELANTLSNLYKSTISSVIVPVVTHQGILVGSYIIKPSDGLFLVSNKSRILHKTYTKKGALILAGILNKGHSKEDILQILSADMVAFSSKNDLEIYKHHYKLAVKRGDLLKKNLMMDRFDTSDCKMQKAKDTLEKYYSKIF